MWHCAYGHEFKPSGRSMARSWGVLAFIWVLLGLFMDFVWNLSVVSLFIQDCQRNFLSFTQNQSCHRCFFLMLCWLGIFICWRGDCVTLFLDENPTLGKVVFFNFIQKLNIWRSIQNTFLCVILGLCSCFNSTLMQADWAFPRSMEMAWKTL